MVKAMARWPALAAVALLATAAAEPPAPAPSHVQDAVRLSSPDGAHSTELHELSGKGGLPPIDIGRLEMKPNGRISRLLLRVGQ